MCGLQRLLVVSLAWWLVTLASAANPSAPVVVNYDYVSNSGDGSYSFVYELDDGTIRTERGKVMMTQDNHVYVTVNGTYSYTDDKGKLRIVEYAADENGYRQKEYQETKPIVPVLRLNPAALGSLVGGGLG